MCPHLKTYVYTNVDTNIIKKNYIYIVYFNQTKKVVC